jgi:crotonobetainyl-CoA:carnitine CoA-transferase CaiB-like acyl-CoA transferase
LTTSKGILSGYRILDCTVAMAGPFAAQRLGDLGADVVKIEPVGGEWQRHVPAGGKAARRINASFLSLNRNKRSLAINLKTEEGRAIVHDLARTADVFMQNYRPSVAQRLGVDYPALSTINPRLVYVSISGYGSSGPYVDYPGQDLLVQAMSGSMYSSGRASDPPQPAGQYVVDATTAYCAFEGALAALLHRERTGEGQLVEINMLDAAITFQMQELSVLTLTGKPQRRSEEPHAHVYIRAPYGVFKTADSYIALGFPPLAKLADVLDEPQSCGMDDNVDGFEKRDLIHRLVAAKLVTKPSDEWLAAMRKADVWAAPVNDFEQMMADPQVAHNGSFIEYDHPTEGRLRTPGFPIRFSKTESRLFRGAPEVGEHTREILSAAGYADADIDDLVSKGVVNAAG